MITVAEAFEKFKSKLEITRREQEDTSRRQNDIRERLRSSFDLERDFLTGSYSRATKTKPLKDVDIFCVLAKKESHYRDKSPSVVLEDFRRVLAEEYGSSNVRVQRRSVQVDFGVPSGNGDSPEQVMSFDVVPAFQKSSYYEIPDTRASGGWVKTNPEVHAEKVTEANKAFSLKWVPAIKMLKKWNETAGKPIKPSFLIEVMALQLLVPPFSDGGYPYEIKTLLATAAERIGETWKDPAGFGPPVSDQMGSFEVQQAKDALRDAETRVSNAIRLARNGRNGDALREWRNLFGPLFPLS